MEAWLWMAKQQPGGGKKMVWKDGERWNLSPDGKKGKKVGPSLFVHFIKGASKRGSKLKFWRKSGPVLSRKIFASLASFWLLPLKFDSVQSSIEHITFISAEWIWLLRRYWFYHPGELMKTKSCLLPKWWNGMSNFFAKSGSESQNMTPKIKLWSPGTPEISGVPGSSKKQKFILISRINQSINQSKEKLGLKSG